MVKDSTKKKEERQKIVSLRKGRKPVLKSAHLKIVVLASIKHEALERLCTRNKAQFLCVICALLGPDGGVKAWSE
jgi:hypothetical protein